MNKVILIGRLTKTPEVRYSQGEKPMAIARYTLAVDRKTKSENGQNADFINCVAFGFNGEFAEKYLEKGTKILVEGRIQTGSYTNKDGATVYTTEVVVENNEFVEPKKASDGFSKIDAPIVTEDASSGFLNVPQGADEELPFFRPTR